MADRTTTSDRGGARPADEDAMTPLKRVGDDHFRMANAAHGIEFDASRLRRERQDLVGELAVSAGTIGKRTIDGVLSVGRFNFSSLRERADHAKRLRERSRSNGVVDWGELLEEFCRALLEADRAGTPAVLLRTLSRPAAGDVLDIEGLRLYRQHPLILFGDGGASKSYLALFIAAALAQQGLTVLFADWELAGEDHRDRLERMFGQFEMPPILYARCDRPLDVEADRLARLREQQRVDFLICDSISFAVDGPPEAADVAARYFQALRRIGVG